MGTYIHAVPVGQYLLGMYFDSPLMKSGTGKKRRNSENLFWMAVINIVILPGAKYILMA
jgi:hypothetical protein